MVFDRLAIGTANWGKEYNGAKVSELTLVIGRKTNEV